MNDEKYKNYLLTKYGLDYEPIGHKEELRKEYQDLVDFTEKLKRELSFDGSMHEETTKWKVEGKDEI